MSKINRIVLIFFIIEEYKKGDKLLLMTYFDKIDFQCTLLLKVGPIFDLLYRYTILHRNCIFAWPPKNC